MLMGQIQVGMVLELEDIVLDVVMVDKQDVRKDMGVDFVLEDMRKD